MNILVDIGNTRLKWAIAESDLITSAAAMDYRQADVMQYLMLVWQALPVPQCLALASVADAGLSAVVIDLANRLWPNLACIIPHASSTALGVNNAYVHAEKLGVDRWLSLIAAHHFYPGFSCIVDCGTAVTVDVINAQGLHLGGLICPGLWVMKKNLVAATTALNFDVFPYACGLADNTQAAIHSGSLLAIVGLIEATLDRLAQPYQLILCGGDAELVAEQLQQPYIIDDQLVLKGLNLYCQAEMCT